MVNKSIQEVIKKQRLEKGIKSDIDLLRKIGKELGVENSYEFAQKEKANFSKMLKGERPLKRQFIEPLEKILGASLHKLLNESEYDTDFSKEDLPFLKSFRYYAYKDDPKLYKELDKLTDTSGKPIIQNFDEYGKTFPQYLMEYNSKNGIKHLVNKYHIKLRPSSGYYFMGDKTWMIYDNSVNMAKLIVSLNDIELFYKAFDPYMTFMESNHRFDLTVFFDESFGEAVLNNDNIFESLFDEREFDYREFYKKVLKDDRNHKIVIVNPILQTCLRVGIKKLDKYRDKVKKILEFGFRYNIKIIERFKQIDNRCFMDENTPEIGVVLDSRFYLLGNVVFVDESMTGDKEIDALLENLLNPIKASL